MTRTLKLFLGVLVALAFLALVGWYFYHQTEGLFRGPEITLLEPVSGETITEPIVNIKGTTKNLQSLTLNGFTITTNENGVFNEVRPLLPGLNVSKIVGTDRFGRSNEVRFEIFHPTFSTPK